MSGSREAAPLPVRPAVVLLSGGLDSATCLALAQADGFTPIALSFRYGQRHAVEVDAARRLADRAGVEHVICDIDLRMFGGSALTDDIEVPKHDDVDELDDELAGGVHPGDLRAGPQHDLPVVRAGAGRGAGGRRHLHRGQRPRLQRLPGLPPRVHRRLRGHGRPGHPGRRRGLDAAHHPHAPHRPDQGRDHRAGRRPRRRLQPDHQLLRPRRQTGWPAAAATRACCGPAASATRASPTPPATPARSVAAWSTPATPC